MNFRDQPQKGLSGRFDKSMAYKSITTFVLSLCLCSLFFHNRNLPPIWALAGIVEVVFFFSFTALFSRSMLSCSISLFTSRIFTYSLLIRLGSTIFSYLFFKRMTGIPFEFDAADSLGYHGEALWIIYLIGIDELDFYFETYLHGLSDAGWPLFLAAIYIVFYKGILVARIINCLISSWMVVLIFRLALRSFGEKTARNASIFALFFPTFIFYSGLHLKETLMIFLLVAFINQADLLLRGESISIIRLVSVTGLGISLFFFRTVLAVAAWFSFISAIALLPIKIIGPVKKITYLIWMVSALILLSSGKIQKEIRTYYKGKSSNLESQMQHFTTRTQGNRLARYGNAALFLPVILVAPFPTMVDTGQPNVMMVTGNLFVRNVLAFFVVISIIQIIRQRGIRHHSLILSITFSYLAVLSLSGYALSERFHVPALPFFLILAGNGLTSLSKKEYAGFTTYLAIIAFVITCWNWFKLAGRGFT